MGDNFYTDDMNDFGSINDDDYDYMTKNFIYSYKIEDKEDDKPKLSKEEIEKIKAESFKDPDDRFSGMFSDIEKNCNISNGLVQYIKYCNKTTIIFY